MSVGPGQSEVDNTNAQGCILSGMVIVTALGWILMSNPLAQGFLLGATTMLAILMLLAGQYPSAGEE